VGHFPWLRSVLYVLPDVFTWFGNRKVNQPVKTALIYSKGSLFEYLWKRTEQRLSVQFSLNPTAVMDNNANSTNYLKIFINCFSQMMNFRLSDIVQPKTDVCLKT